MSFPDEPKRFIRIPVENGDFCILRTFIKLDHLSQKSDRNIKYACCHRASSHLLWDQSRFSLPPTDFNLSRDF